MDLEQSSFFFLLFPLSSVDRSRASAAYDDVITKQDVFQWIGFVLLTHTRHAYRQTSVAGKPGISPFVLQPTTSFFVQVAVNFIYFVVLLLNFVLACHDKQGPANIILITHDAAYAITLLHPWVQGKHILIPSRKTLTKTKGTDNTFHEFPYVSN